MDADERARLIGAAWTVLERSGFEGFKVQLVMREAGVSARGFYHHFRDKDELLLALLQDEMARAAARLAAALAQIDDPIGKVEAWIRSIIDAAADPKRIARARLFSSLPRVLRRFPTEVDEGTRLLIDPLRGAIVEGVARGVFPWADPDRDSEVIYRLTGGSLTSALAERPDSAVDAVVARATDFALRALGIAPPPPPNLGSEATP